MLEGGGVLSYSGDPVQELIALLDRSQSELESRMS
jgi:hypothetical protein